MTVSTSLCPYAHRHHNVSSKCTPKPQLFVNMHNETTTIRRHTHHNRNDSAICTPKPQRFVHMNTRCGVQVDETLWFRNKVESLEQMMTVSLMFNVDDSPDSEVSPGFFLSPNLYSNILDLKSNKNERREPEPSILTDFAWCRCWELCVAPINRCGFVCRVFNRCAFVCRVYQPSCICVSRPSTTAFLRVAPVKRFVFMSRAPAALHLHESRP